MTRAQTASYGVVTPPPLDRWIDAVLMLCVSLVQGVTTTLEMWLGRKSRECHTRLPGPALPQAKSDTERNKDVHPTHSVILGPVPRIPVGPPKGFAIDPFETNNQDSRHKPEHDSAVAEAPEPKAGKARVPREGGDPVLRAAQTHDHNIQRSALTRAAQTPAFAGDAVERVVRNSLT